MPNAKENLKYPAQFNEIAWYRTNVPCMQACPVHTDSGRYVQLIADGRYEDAFFTARSPNPLASICGRICAAPCEDACRRGWIDQAVTIRALKRFVTERHGVESSRPDTFLRLCQEAEDPGCSRPWHLSRLGRRSTKKIDQKVAVIGSGPAGLACAHDLAVMGYRVTVFEALEQPGGMLRYGIPEYRLPRGVIEREVAAIERLGVEFRTGVRLDRAFNLQSLRDAGYEAFFLAVGAMQGRELKIPGHDRDGVVKAVDYLLNLNRGYRVDLGKRVVVIGGGLVALDAARTAVRKFYHPMEEIERTAEAVLGQPAMDAARGALRSGAQEVHVVSLESFGELPAAQTVQGQEEIHAAMEEGIVFHPAWGPKEIQGNPHVTGIDLIACTRVFNDTGGFDPRFDASKILHLDADAVILAIGQKPDFSFLSDEDGIELTAGGTVKIDPETLATTAPGIYAGGDAAFGPRIAIEAVANGKRAAQSIHEYLCEGSTTPKLTVRIQRIPTDEYKMFSGYEKQRRTPPRTVETGRRTGILEVEEVYLEDEAALQAQRCLSCHIDTVYDPQKCVLCGRCADVCPERCLVFVPIEQVDMPEDQKATALRQYGHGTGQPLTVLLKDDTGCIRCGLCALRCPTEAMTMERFHFVEAET